MKNFLSKIFFGIFALLVIGFLFVMIYKTLVKAEITEKSKYEDEVVKKVNEVTDMAEKEAKEVIGKITNNDFGLDESAATYTKVLAEKSYSSINSQYEDFSSYSGYFIGTDGYIYAFYIKGNSQFGTLSLEDRNKLMLLNSKKIGSIKKADLTEIKRLVKKVKTTYDEKENEVEESAYDTTKMTAVYDYSRNLRISINEEGKYTVNNVSDCAEDLLYYISLYLKSYKISYDEFTSK